jgi:hypothetical protein
VRTRLCRAQARTTAQEAEIAGLRARLAPEKVPYHTYPAQMMALAVFMVVQGGASLRCAATTVEFFSNLMGWTYPKPSHTTVRDCTHEMMNIVKTLFKNDRELSRLSAQLGSLRQQLSLAKWSGLLPPTLRDKDRFLRIFTIVKWAGTNG